jgi:hypothetical protein
MDERLATLKAVSICCTMFQYWINAESLSWGTVVCKHFASYQGYHNYWWDLIWYAKDKFLTIDCIIFPRIADKFSFTQWMRTDVFSGIHNATKRIGRAHNYYA